MATSSAFLAGLDRERGDKLGVDAWREDERDRQTGRRDTEQLLQFVGEEGAQPLRVGDILEVAAARLRHRAEQPLVEVLPHADRGRGDAAPPQLSRVPRQLPWIENPDVGQSIGEQDDAPDARCRGVRSAAGVASAS